MEDYIQFSAKTKSEAITKACIELGVSSDQLEIQVISEGSNGFFGIGSKPAVIKVRKIEPVSEEEEMKEIVETVKLDSFKEEAPVQEEKVRWLKVLLWYFVENVTSSPNHSGGTNVFASSSVSNSTSASTSGASAPSNTSSSMVYFSASGIR